MTLGTLSETNILNAVEWFDRVGAAGGTVANSVQLVFECLCTRDADASKTSNEPSTALSSSAWPRPKGMVNTTICAAGCAADGSGTDEEFETARQLVMEAPGVILSSGQLSELGGVRTAPNAVEPYHDLNMVCLTTCLSLPFLLPEILGGAFVSHIRLHPVPYPVSVLPNSASGHLAPRKKIISRYCCCFLGTRWRN